MNRMGERTGGFTLIELLVVVAIISILSAIAVPNFLEAQTRAKVARVKADMRSMATAIETYRVDNNNYPFRRNVRNATPKLNPYVPDMDYRIQQMSRLTTPIAYINYLFQDVFERQITVPNNIIDYYDPTQASWLINSKHPMRKNFQVSPAEAGWLLVSVGPDGQLGVYDLTGGWLYNRNDSTYKQTIYFPYDPTNGTISTGNIYSGEMGGTDNTGKFLFDKFFPQAIYGQ